MIIRALHVTPIAFADPPLLNVDGVHEPHVLRAVIELVVDDGRGGDVTGLGECAGHSWQLDWLTLVGGLIVGRSVFDSTGLRDLVDAALTGAIESIDTSPGAEWRRWADITTPAESRGPAPIPATLFDRRRVYSALEVASLDAQGKLLGVPSSTSSAVGYATRCPTARICSTSGTHILRRVPRRNPRRVGRILSIRLGSYGRPVGSSTATGSAR